MDMRLLCIVKKRGVDTLAAMVTAENADLSISLKNVPGVGKPFLLFANLPDGTPATVDFTDAPIVSLDTATNQAAIDDQLANPRWDALGY